MAKSNAQTGQYYKHKTKKWFLDKGYAAEYIEQLQRIFVKGRVILVKRDLFASDILAMNSSELIFAQVKFGKKNIAAAIKEFNKHTFPPFCQKWIIVWELRAREPEIVLVD